MARIAVLALQGGYAAHEGALAALGHTPVEVRTPEDLDGCEGLMLPGGESTAMLELLATTGLEQPLSSLVASGVPVLATCAGLILSARAVTGPVQRSLGWLDVAVARNAWGRQLDSFEARSDDGSLPLVFIRAPRITEVGAGVAVVATFRGEPVLVRSGAFTAATFHPELTADSSVHRGVFGGV